MSSKSFLILDTGPLSYFTYGEVFDVFRRLFANRMFIPRSVFKETQYDHKVHENTLNAISNGWLRVVENLTGEEIQVASELFIRGLSIGEAETIAIASARKWILVCDESLARKIAREMNIFVTGSLGLLYKAVQNQVLTAVEADQAIDRMRQENQRIPSEISSFADLSRFVVSRGRDRFLNEL